MCSFRAIFSQHPTKILYVFLISHVQQDNTFNPANIKLLCHMLNILTLTTLATRAPGIITTVPRLNLNGMADVLVNNEFNVHGSVHCKNILIYIQQDAMLHSLLYLETALHILGGTSTQHQEHMQLYLQYLVFVTQRQVA